jgi:hypothetical protein
MNFLPLFTTARVVRSSYQIVLTIWLFYHLVKRINERQGPRHRSPRYSGRDGRWLDVG